MKWLAAMMALVAIVSGCLSLNKGSDQVAQGSASKGAAEKPSVASTAAVATQTAAAAPGSGERSGDATRRQADLLAEVSVASLPQAPDLPSERPSAPVVRASPPEPSRPRTPAPASEPAPAVPETKAPEPQVIPAAAVTATNPSEAKLPAIINGTGEGAGIEPPLPRPSAAVVRMVNSKRLSLNYEIKDVGPSGVSTVELWYTRDGRKWEKYDTTSQPRPPFVVDLKDEGLYGFSLVARNGVGLGKPAPRAGDQPQIWVDVDATRPVVKLLETQIGVSGEAQYLSIRWKAADDHLGPRPITVSYSEQAAGPWTPIAGNLENTGSYIWQLPAAVPAHLLVRVEASDLVGNIGTAQMPEPILLDLSQPSVSIVAVEPVGK